MIKLLPSAGPWVTTNIFIKKQQQQKKTTVHKSVSKPKVQKIYKLVTIIFFCKCHVIGVM